MEDPKLDEKCALYRLLLHPNKISIGKTKCIDEALKLVTSIVGAGVGYIEIQNYKGRKCWSTQHCSDEDLSIIRTRISKTIIKEALSTGETIVTSSAVLDDRFSCAGSVVAGNIESVLCSPLDFEGYKGVIYLQGDLSGLCNAQNIDEADFFSRNIQPLLMRLRYSFLEESPEDDLRQMYNLEGVIGASSRYTEVLNEAMTVAPFDVSLILTGETGTGKTHLAKVIHDNSPRRKKNFVHVNCANIPEQLFESELFGAVKGAYSGASDTHGKIQSADKGTLFLDEIGEMPILQQAKLLQFLDNGFFYPLGSSTPKQPDVRVIVASNIDFKKSIEAGAFREDLYHRIANFELIVPALRNRKDDIAALVHFYFKKYAEKFDAEKVELSVDFIRQLEEYDWPGNIRELQNRLQQGILKAKMANNNLLTAKDVLGITSEGIMDSFTFGNEKLKWEKSFISNGLKNNSWNISKTAIDLDMSRSHLNRLIRSHQLADPKKS